MISSICSPNPLSFFRSFFFPPPFPFSLSPPPFLNHFFVFFSSFFAVESRASGGDETVNSVTPPLSGFLRDQRVSKRNFLARSLACFKLVDLCVVVALVVGGFFVCLVFYCVGNSLFIVQKTRSIQSLLLLPALSLRARKQIIKRSKAPIHTYTPDGKCQSLLHLPNSHRSNSVTTGEDYFSLLLSLFFLFHKSKLLLLLDIMQTHFLSWIFFG